MPKFRKKPVVITAEQYIPYQHVPDGVEFRETGDANDETRAVIVTLEGELHVSPLDWVITGVKGERYACKPDIFEMTYEAAE